MTSRVLSNTSGWTDASDENNEISYVVALPVGIGMYLLSFMTFIGNAMVLHAIRTEKRLQTVSNMFIMSLALADLTVGVIVMPISSAYAITGDWRFGYIVCQFWLCVDYTASTASIFNLSILSLDRYWSITTPLRYLRRRTKKRALILIALAWTSAATWLVPVLGWRHIVHGGKSQLSVHVCDTEFATNMTFKVVTSILNFYLPTACMIVLNVKIFLAIKKRSRDIERLGAYTATGTNALTANPRENQSCDSLTDSPQTNARSTDRNQGSKTRNSCHFGADADSSLHSSLKVGEKSAQFGRLAVVQVNHRQSDLPQLGSARKARAETLKLYEGILVKVEYQTSNSEEDDEDFDEIGQFYMSTKKSSKKAKGSKQTKEHSGSSRSKVKKSQNCCSEDNSDDASRHSQHLHCYRSTRRSRGFPSSTCDDSSKRLQVSDCINRSRNSNVDLRSTLSEPSELRRVASERSASELRSRALQRTIIRRNDRSSSTLASTVETEGESRPTGNGSRKSPFHSPFGSFFNGVWRKNQTRQGQNGNANGDIGTASYQPQRANPNLVLAKEKKAATQLGVIVGAFILCWLPYFTLFMVVAYCGRDQCINQTFFTTTVWFGYFNSTLNPFLYPLCNAHFKRAFKRMLRIKTDNKDLQKRQQQQQRIVSKVN